MMDKIYNPWPIGKIPKEFQRPELDQLKELGYKFNDAREVIDIFEKKVAEFAGSKYAVSVDCCSHAIELSFRYLINTGELNINDKVLCPKHTYVSAAIAPIHAGLNVELIDVKWSGIYQYVNSRVYDSAVKWEKNMYVGNDILQCLSFQIKKPICIGRGGMVLTNDRNAADWIRLAAYDGRNLNSSYDSVDHVKFLGYHYYMEPESAARGIILMDRVKFTGDSACYLNYPDITNWIK